MNSYEMLPTWKIEEDSNSNINHTLSSMCNHVLINMNKKENHDRKLYCTTIDNQLVNIARSMQASTSSRKINYDINVIVATDLNSVGGHSRVAFNFKSESIQNFYILTDIFNSEKNDIHKNNFLKEKLGNENFIILDNGTPFEKVISLIAEINKLSPRYISCFNHHFDPIPILGALSFKNCKKIYYHHCDHSPSIGATIKEFIHIDTNSFTNEKCRASIIDSTTLPLSLKMDSCIKSNFNVHEPISFISAGAFHKYEFSDSQFYLNYPKIIALLLTNQNTKFYHAGDMPGRYLDLIFQYLSINNINHENFLYVGNISSLTNFFRDMPNKIFIPSFPRGGGLTLIEFLSLSTPILPFHDAEINTISSHCFRRFYEDSFSSWKDENELIDAANKIIKSYELHSKIAGNLFNTQHSNSINELYVNKIFS